MKKICEFCKIEYLTVSKRQRFCCKNCSKYHWNKVHNYKPKSNPIKRKVYNTSYRLINKEKIKTVNANWYKSNKEKSSLKGREYRQNNSDKVRDINRKYKAKYRKRNTKQAKERYKNDLNFRLRMTLRARLKGAIKNHQKVGSAVSDLGCTIEELKIYLESLFKPGMSWDNYGKYGWHIDHIKPLSSFNLSNSEEFKEACYYTNLQPLWAKDNLSKGNKI